MVDYCMPMRQKHDAKLAQPYLNPKPAHCRDFKSETDPKVHVQVIQYVGTSNRWWVSGYNDMAWVSYGFHHTQKMAEAMARRLVLEIEKENRSNDDQSR